MEISTARSNRNWKSNNYFNVPSPKLKNVSDHINMKIIIAGIHPCYVGDLPPQCAALNRTNISVQELAVRGIVEKDKTKILQALLLDPLTSATLSIDEIVKMADEMFQVDKKYLKGFK